MSNILSTMLIGIAVVVILSCAAYFFAPFMYDEKIDRYTGQRLIIIKVCGIGGEVSCSTGEHTSWVRKFRPNVKSDIICSYASIRENWFGQKITYGRLSKGIIDRIYNLKIPEIEKTGLLIRYHEDLDASTRPGSFFTDGYTYELWDKKLAKLE